MLRIAVLLYGIAGYAASLTSFGYLIGFLGNRYTFSTIDSGLQLPPMDALTRNLQLLGLFALHHSLMARGACKRWFANRFPYPVERTTYVLATSGILFTIYRYWEPIPEFVWHINNPFGTFILHALFWLGWILVFYAAGRMGHTELFGLRQAWLYARGRVAPKPRFREPGPYRWVRHPMMLGTLLAVWSTPAMSLGHLLFAAFFTLYVPLALVFEERDLEAEYGEDYRRYRSQTGCLLPRRLRL